MNILDWLKKFFRKKIRDGKHFTYEEKNTILGLLDDCEAGVLYCEAHDCKCLGMCYHLKFFYRYDYLCELYHNRDFYRERTKVTSDNLYFWGRKDYYSRLTAIEMLRDAIIND